MTEPVPAVKTAPAEPQEEETAGDGKAYLSLPRVNKEKFQELLQELKQDGARFDQNKKKWYIDGNCDREKFLQYLEPDSQGRFPAPVSGQEAGMSERASVLSRLKKAKEAAAGHGMDDQIRDAQHQQEEKVRETGHGRE